MHFVTNAKVQRRFLFIASILILISVFGACSKSPTLTPPPTATSTVPPAATATPITALTVTPALQPTSTILPSPTSLPMATAIPTQQPAPTATPLPTATATVTATPASSPQPILTLSKDGITRLMAMEDIKKMPAFEGTGRFINNAEQIMGPFQIKVIPLIDLCQVVGGATLADAIRIVAKDGYTFTIAVQHIEDNTFDSYGDHSGDVIVGNPVKIVLAYNRMEAPSKRLMQGL